MRRGIKVTAFAVLLAVLMMIVLSGCGGGGTPTPASEVEAYVSSYLDASYEGALPATSQFILGTLLLEGTTNAVTPEQAKALLPLWQALQGGSLQGQAEVNAVLGQIERAMTAEQLQAIAALQLTQEDLAAWAQERGMNMAQGPGGPGGTPGVGPWGTPGAWPRGTPGPGGTGGFGDPQARETMRAGFDSMSEEERAQRMAELRATAEAGGMTLPEGGGGFGQGGRVRVGVGQFGFLLDPLIELLTQRAGSS